MWRLASRRQPFSCGQISSLASVNPLTQNEWSLLGMLESPKWSKITSTVPIVFHKKNIVLMWFSGSTSQAQTSGALKEGIHKSHSRNYIEYWGLHQSPPFFWKALKPIPAPGPHVDSLQRRTTPAAPLRSATHA